MPTLTTSAPTNTPAPSATPTIPRTPIPIPEPSSDVGITHIHADGTGSQAPDEYVEIRNDDSRPIQLSGWTLRDEANRVFRFPSYVMQPGQVCRVYTNEDHPQQCGFSPGSGAAIWNNSGGCAYLRDGRGVPIDPYFY